MAKEVAKRMTLAQYKSRQEKFREVILQGAADIITPRNLNECLRVALQIATGTFVEQTIEGKGDYNPNTVVAPNGYPTDIPDIAHGSEVKITRRYLKPDQRPLIELLQTMKDWGVDVFEGLRPQDAEAKVVNEGLDLSKLPENEKAQFLYLLNKAANGEDAVEFEEPKTDDYVVTEVDDDQAIEDEYSNDVTNETVETDTSDPS